MVEMAVKCDRCFNQKTLTLARLVMFGRMYNDVMHKETNLLSKQYLTEGVQIQ